MAGRNGIDDLNWFLFTVLMVCMVLQIFIGGVLGTIFNLLGLVSVVLFYFRTFSRNLYQRSEENAKYNEIRSKVTGKFRRQSSTDKTHRIYNCPQCGQKVRVPRGRGKIQIRCPKCGRQFVKRT